MLRGEKQTKPETHSVVCRLHKAARNRSKRMLQSSWKLQEHSSSLDRGGPKAVIYRSCSSRAYSTARCSQLQKLERRVAENRLKTTRQHRGPGLGSRAEEEATVQTKKTQMRCTQKNRQRQSGRLQGCTKLGETYGSHEAVKGRGSRGDGSDHCCLVEKTRKKRPAFMYLG